MSPRGGGGGVYFYIMLSHCIDLWTNPREKAMFLSCKEQTSRRQIRTKKYTSCRNRHQHRCMTCQRWGCKQVSHPPAGQAVNNLHVPSKYHSGTTHRPIHQAHVLSSPPPSAVNGNISTATGEIRQMLHDMKSEIRSDMQSLTTRMEKLEASPSSKLPPSSGVSGSSSRVF